MYCALFCSPIRERGHTWTGHSLAERVTKRLLSKDTYLQIKQMVIDGSLSLNLGSCHFKCTCLTKC